MIMGSYTENPARMRILITGAGGFLGQGLAKVLMVDPAVASLTLTDVVQPTIPHPTYEPTCEVHAIEANLTEQSACTSLLNPSLTHIYLLHGIMSGAAEANLELGLHVNVDSMRLILDRLRKVKPGIRVIFPSSLAVFGPLPPATVTTEATVTLPQSSYGAQKLMTEILINDYSRRGLIDGRVVRLPTIIVRPGQPTGAASSFCSGIIREPLKGLRSELPVQKGLKLWVCGAKTVITNLVVARDVDEAKFDGGSRTVNLPGVTVTVQEILDALEMVGGERALDLVEEKPDKKVEAIVGSWPAEFDVRRAKELGFKADVELVQTVRNYVVEYGSAV